jgi:hypothetical protein
MFNVSICEYFLVLNVFIVCIHNTVVFKLIPLLCTHVYLYMFSMFLDPVCFRAAVFCNTLADWCGQWNITIDVNQFSESHHEFILLLKLRYRPTRWVRMVEAMVITHFIAGAHRYLINEILHTMAGPFERFLRWQRLNAPEMVESDDDLHRAIEKLEICDNKRVADLTAHPPQPPHQPFRR